VSPRRGPSRCGTRARSSRVRTLSPPPRAAGRRDRSERTATPSNQEILPMRSCPLPIVRLVAVAGLLAALAEATPVRAESAGSTGDSAPFWTGKPNAAQFKARQEKRLALAKNALHKMLALKGTHTIANTLAPFDEISRQLDMTGSQSGLIEEVSPDSLTRATAEDMSQEISKFSTDLSLNRQVYDALTAMNLAGADAETKYYV